MRFNEMVAAAQAQAQAAADERAESALHQDALSAQQMRELNAHLAAMAGEIAAIPASLDTTDLCATIKVQRAGDGASLTLATYFNTDIYGMYFIAWGLSTRSTFDEGHRKAATCEEAIAELAVLIGRFQAGADLDGDA